MRYAVVATILLLLVPPAALRAETVHTVVPGDTVFSLSRSHGVSQEALMGRNGMTSPAQLRLGMRLYIPVPAAAALPAHSSRAVQPGETLYGIARLAGISVQALRDLNGFPQNHILQAGSVIRVPVPAGFALPPQALPPPPIPPPLPVPPLPVTPIPAPPLPVNVTAIPVIPPVPTVTGHTMHTVRPGETLFSIARGAGVTLQALREINGFPQSHVLRSGEAIRIPASLAVVSPPAIPPPSAVPPPIASPLPPVQGPARRRADPSLGWPILSSEIVYMEGNLGGVMILGRESESVRSISRGTVVHAGPWRGYGNVVIVESPGGFRLIYGANETLSVRRGDAVEVGTEVGKLGVHPTSGRPELVFIVLRNGIPVDPATAPRS